MKKMIILAAIAATVVASCAKEPLSKEEKVKQGMIPYTATVKFDATKSTIDDTKIVWEVGDKVAVFDDINADPNEFTVTGVTDGGAYIEGEISGSATKLYGVYPFSAAVSLTLSSEGEDSLTVNLPSAQTIAAGKVIASDALVTVSSKADVGSDLNFWNPFSVVKFTVPVDGVKKVVFSGLDNKGVTGKQIVGTVGKGTNLIGKSSLTVSKADGFAKSTAYYATVFSREVAGLRFVLTTDDYKADVESAKTAEFVKNKGLFFEFTETQIKDNKFPINIYTKDDLDSFAAHSALYDAGEWVNLCADIDYDAEWTSVADFVGNFNGGNHSIYGTKNGLTFKANSKFPEYIGFFSKVYNQVKDLKLGYNPAFAGADTLSDLRYTSSTIKYAGILCGSVASRTGVGPAKITNVSNYCGHHTDFTAAAGDIYAGNISGYVSCDDAELIECVNYGVLGNISNIAKPTTALYYGGIAGLVKGNNVTMTDCANYGNIKARTKNLGSQGNFFLGGMVGRTGSSTSNVKFIRCIAGGNIYDSSRNLSCQIFIGGILGADNTTAGTAYYDVIMEDCVNICKQLEIGSQSKNCAAGGMIGFAKSKLHLKGCINGKQDDATLGTMPIGGNNLTYAGYGGIIGKSDASGLIENCINYAPISLKSGKSFSKVCPNGFGKGGIVGLALTGDLSIEGCKNYGNIEMAYTAVTKGYTAGAGIGGIIGCNNSAGTISNCESYGNITETGTVAEAGAGALVGYQAAIEQTGAGCKVDCTVTASNASGMIVGNNAGTSVWGTAGSKIKVAGTYNGEQLNGGNYASYLYGGTGAATCNAEFWVK